MWKIDLNKRIAEHQNGFTIQSNGGDRWEVISGENDPELIKEGKLQYLHEYSKDYIKYLTQERGLTLKKIANTTQEEINNSPSNNNYGYSKISKEYLESLLEGNETLFPIELCSLIRRAINLRC